MRKMKRRVMKGRVMVSEGRERRRRKRRRTVRVMMTMYRFTLERSPQLPRSPTTGPLTMPE